MEPVTEVMLMVMSKGGEGGLVSDRMASRWAGMRSRISKPASACLSRLLTTNVPRRVVPGV